MPPVPGTPPTSTGNTSSDQCFEIINLQASYTYSHTSLPCAESFTLDASAQDIREYRTVPHDADETAAFNDFQKNWDAHIKSVQDMVSLSQGQQTQAATAVFHGDAHVSFRDAGSKLRHLIDLTHTKANAAREAAAKSISRAQWFISDLILATLSAGPLGIGDALGSISAANLLRSVRSDGVIVKPDVPITPVDSVLLSDAQKIDTPMVAATYRRLWKAASNAKADMKKWRVTASKNTEGEPESARSALCVVPAESSAPPTLGAMIAA